MILLSWCIFFLNAPATTVIDTSYTLFPYTTLFRSGAEPVRLVLGGAGRAAAAVAGTAVRRWRAFAADVLPQFRPARGARGGRHSRQQPQPARGAARQDRKSTRLNSSH